MSSPLLSKNPAIPVGALEYDYNDPFRDGMLPEDIANTHYMIYHDDDGDIVETSPSRNSVWVPDVDPNAKSWQRIGKYRIPVRADSTWMPLNEPFSATMKIVDGWEKYYHAKDTVTGCRFTLLTKDLWGMIDKLDKGCITLEWSVQKFRGDCVLRPHSKAKKVKKPKAKK